MTESALVTNESATWVLRLMLRICLWMTWVGVCSFAEAENKTGDGTVSSKIYEDTVPSPVLQYRPLSYLPLDDTGC